MTVADQIKKQFGPFDIDRLFAALRNRVALKTTFYFSNHHKIDFIRQSRLGVWEFKFIDGSSITIRVHSEQ